MKSVMELKLKLIEVIALLWMLNWNLLCLPAAPASRNYGNEQPSCMFLRPRMASPCTTQIACLLFFRSHASHCQPFSQLLTAALIITISNGQSLLSDGKVQHASTMFNLGPWWTWAIFSHFSHSSRHKTGNDYVNICEWNQRTHRKRMHPTSTYSTFGRLASTAKS